MGADARFKSPEYLFYVANMIEQDRLSSTIRVCANLRKSKERLKNLHVYTKGLRGTFEIFIYNLSVFIFIDY